jgi:DNA polymerase-1
MKKMLIVDGNSLLFRAYYATYNPDKNKLMATKAGTPTNAIFAFSNMFMNLLKSLKEGDGIFVAFDKGKHTFRHKEYEEYKANRKPLPQELAIQMPIARKFLDSLNVPYFEDDDIEADDIAGIMAKLSKKDGYSVYLYTSDKDYLQLIDDNTTVELIKRGLKDIKEYTPTTFKEDWGFEPIEIVDYKGLMGDPSDNLKGIPKIGDKTAKELIKKYGTLENIIEHVSELKPAISKSITENKEQGLFCKKMAEMQLDRPLPYTPQQAIYKGYELSKVKAFAEQYEFHNLLTKLPKSFEIRDLKDSDIEYSTVGKIPFLDSNDEFGFAIDTSDDNYHEATLYGISVTIGENNYYENVDDFLKDEVLISRLKDEKIGKYVFDFKKIRCVLSRYNIDIEGLKFDLLLASYLLNPSLNNDLVSILAYFAISIPEKLKSKNLLTREDPLFTSYASFYPTHLYDRIISNLMEINQYNLLIKMEQPLATVLADMEIEGFPLNSAVLQSFGDEFKKKIDALTFEIYRQAGHELNINSTRELATVLFDELKLSSNKKQSTSIEYLKDLIDKNPIVANILEYRKYSKLLSTYVNGLLPYIREDGKIHATFNQAVTQTGRLSSSEPNLQNISVRDEDGKQIRKAFFYDDPSLNIISLDYSQIELRILASMSNSKSLIEVFNSGEDIHTATAKKVFHLTGDPTPAQRRKAKAVNFGIVYGISDRGLSDQLGIPLDEAKEIISSFNDEFPEVKNFLDGLIAKAEETGYATTLFNRRRYLPELKDPNYNIREFAKRAAMNAPIQGSAADLIKIAMIEVANKLKEKGYKAKIISQIHDELILKADDKEKDDVLKLVKDIMEHCVELKVPLKVEGGYAKTWFDAK